MFKKGSLKANVASMFSANLLYALSSWAQLSLVAKFLDGITLGNYTLAIAIVTPLYLLSNMQLRSLIITDHKQEFSYSDYFRFRNFGNLFFIIIIVNLSIFLKNENPAIIILFALIKVVESNADVINAFFQREQQMHKITISLGLKSILGFIGVLIGVLVFRNLVYGLFFSLILNLSFYAFYDVGNVKQIKSSYVSKSSLYKIKTIFYTALPLGIVIFLISLNTNIAKFFLEKYLGTVEQGIYSSISYVIILGSFVCNAVGQSFSPQLSKFYQEKRIKEFNLLLVKFFKLNITVGILGIIVALLAGELVLTILFNSEIAKYKTLLVLVMIQAFFIYIATVLGYTLTSMREFKIQPKINVVVLVLNIILLYVLVSNYGMFGAVYASICCYIIQCILIGVYIKLQFKSRLYDEHF